MYEIKYEPSQTKKCLASFEKRNVFSTSFSFAIHHSLTLKNKTTKYIWKDSYLSFLVIYKQKTKEITNRIEIWISYLKKALLRID